MLKPHLTICYLTKRPNAIASMASILRTAFQKITATQTSKPEDINAKGLDLLIADAEFTNLYSGNYPTLYVIPKKDIEQYLKSEKPFITEDELNTHAIVRSVKNIIDFKKLSDALEETSVKDALTGLYNQKFLLEALSKEVKKALRYNYPLTLLYAGIDGLKKINAKYGPSVGDRVIVDFSLIMANSVREVDTIGRFYGDEFLAVLPETTLANSVKVCERIQKATKNLAFANGEIGLNVSIGIGLSSLSSALRSKERLLESVRCALEGAKKRGAGSICTYEEAKLIDEPTRENKELIDVIQRHILMLTEETKKTHFGNIFKLFNEMPSYKKILSHSEHVAFYSERLAEKLGLGKDERETVRNSAILHDIGKLAIDERIVMKNGTLSSAEYATIKQHPIFAAQMLSGSPFIKNEVNTILHHHEHFDGNGYPDHMRGSHIPLGSRIIALAEGLDTMVSTQPYREAMPLDMALSELKKCAGSQFDPELATVFTGLIEN